MGEWAVVKNGLAVVAVIDGSPADAREHLDMRTDSFLCQVVWAASVPVQMLDAFVDEQSRYWERRATAPTRGDS